MGKPRLIIIIRHAQSEGNRDKTIHQATPDHKVSLTPEGEDQARQAGEKLRSLLREDDSLHFFISPYKRTRQTTEGILSTLCSNDPAPSPFQRHHIKVYEEPRIREQDFGNFQPGTDEVERLWRERASYGHFFYRIPNGESGADVYDRVSSFNGSLWRRFSEDQMASVAVLVTHGLCSRVFLMAWYHYSVEFFEDLRNINHCEFLVMKLGNNGKYVLQNQLRRWSDLRRERAAQRKSVSASSPPQHIPVHRWHNHATDNTRSVKPPKRQNTADLFKDDDETSKTEGQMPQQNSSPRNESQQDPVVSPTEYQQRDKNSQQLSQTNQSLLTQSLQELKLTNSPRFSRSQTKAYLGRDGGGSRSGAASPFEMSDEESNEDTSAAPAKNTEPQEEKLDAIDVPTPKQPSSMARALRGELMDEPGRVLADALGDHSEPEIERVDVELGTRDRERSEIARIVAEEVRERSHHSDLY
ncbi:hypothetical protein LTS08_000747 [Lithohypha guttulata]|uniref:uncharacterized protein n=1 Tax=Lithohypha guttulata TaxID=1690604 RepID=UPI002DE16641|nr:hypothetical protein LTR51_006642 [Lithohypha guttulata]KAK5106626.1 hypothetical protein LTS08_000747 [Lithohypha guttulata]